VVGDPERVDLRLVSKLTKVHIAAMTMTFLNSLIKAETNVVHLNAGYNFCLDTRFTKYIIKIIFKHDPRFYAFDIGGSQNERLICSRA